MEDSPIYEHFIYIYIYTWVMFYNQLVATTTTIITRCGSPALAARHSRFAQEGRQLCHLAAKEGVAMARAAEAKNLSNENKQQKQWNKNKEGGRIEEIWWFNNFTILFQLISGGMAKTNRRRCASLELIGLICSWNSCTTRGITTNLTPSHSKTTLHVGLVNYCSCKIFPRHTT